MHVFLEDAKKKQELKEDVHGFFDSQNFYTEFVIPRKRGIILHGSPRNGKALAIKSLLRSLRDRGDHISTLYVKPFVPRRIHTVESSVYKVCQHACKRLPLFLF